MTPPPNNPDDYAQALVEFKKGGWIVALLGGLGVLVRWLLSEEDHGPTYWIRRIVAGSLVGFVAYFALYSVEMDGVYKSIILSTSGAFSPELFEYARQKLNATLKRLTHR